MLRYYKLFDLLLRKNLKLSDLRKVLSSATIAKLSKGEYISGEALDKLCEFLICQPEDIMEHYRVLNQNENSQEIIAIKTIKIYNDYGEEIPTNVHVKGITEPLNKNGQPVKGWYEKDIKNDYDNLDYWERNMKDYENALLNKNIKEQLDNIFGDNMP